MLPASSLIIVGTDTDAGKTHVTRSIWTHFAPTLRVCKPVGTGYPADNDVAYAQATPLIHYTPAISPHLAAELANRPITLPPLLRQIHDLAPHLIETAGGLLCPLNRRDLLTNLDLILALERPVLLVVPNQLGCVNHALMTLALLKQRQIPIFGYVMNRKVETNPTIQADNPAVIHAYTAARYLGEFLPNSTELPEPLRSYLHDHFRHENL